MMLRKCPGVPDFQPERCECNDGPQASQSIGACSSFTCTGGHAAPMPIPGPASFLAGWRRFRLQLACRCVRSTSGLPGLLLLRIILWLYTYASKCPSPVVSIGNVVALLTIGFTNLVKLSRCILSAPFQRGRCGAYCAHAATGRCFVYVFFRQRRVLRIWQSEPVHFHWWRWQHMRDPSNDT